MLAAFPTDSLQPAFPIVRQTYFCKFVEWKNAKIQDLILKLTSWQILGTPLLTDKRSLQDQQFNLETNQQKIKIWNFTSLDKDPIKGYDIRQKKEQLISSFGQENIQKPATFFNLPVLNIYYNNEQK